LDEALHEVNVALKLKSDDPEYVNTLACIQYDMGEADGAISSFKRAIAKSKKPNPADLYGLAVTFLSKGDQAAAIKNFQEAVKSDPSYASSNYIRDKIGLSVHALASHEKLLSLSGVEAQGPEASGTKTGSQK
jgi:tetratricopeptide (TPR) repeat protein